MKYMNKSIEELHEFLEKNPQAKEYVEGLNK